ncbi:MAG: bifunctional metallophosphatase/5'-nucleotidase, partial [Armatimonadota bacterium]
GAVSAPTAPARTGEEPRRTAANQVPMPSLTLIHTNDTHGRIVPPVSDAIAALTAELQPDLLLDAGDSITAGNLGFRIGGEPVLETMSQLGYTAMCLGNRETHPRKEIFPRKIDCARFPILCANAVAKGDAPLPLQPHLRLEREGVRIGLFGVTVPMFTKKQWSQPLCDYWFDNPLKCAREQVELLRPEVDLLIALTHIGHAQDLQLAEQCPELDLVIGGHSHTDLQAPDWVGHVPVIQARAFGFYAGLARLEVEEGTARLVHWEKRVLRKDYAAK